MNLQQEIQELKEDFKELYTLKDGMPCSRADGGYSLGQKYGVTIEFGPKSRECYREILHKVDARIKFLESVLPTEEIDRLHKKYKDPKKNEELQNRYNYCDFNAEEAKMLTLFSGSLSKKIHKWIKDSALKGSNSVHISDFNGNSYEPTCLYYALEGIKEEGYAVAEIYPGKDYKISW